MVVSSKNIVRILLVLAFLVIVKPMLLAPFSLQTAANQTILKDSSPNAKNGSTDHPPYYQLIREYSKQYGVDYRLIYALIHQESRFNPDAKSDQGACGLMQVVPAMDDESDNVASGEEDEDADADVADLSVPEENIKAGVSYFASMMHLFDGCNYDDQIRLALAAYNAGPARIYDAQDVAAYFSENPRDWSSVRNALPMLSMRYYSLHKAVWKGGRPRNGYFGDSRQTIGYVDHVMKYYSTYCQKFRG